ncbi:sulfurtransferase TusA family protein [Vulcanisaeta sp. JCM 16159]|uniref:sulfurtransferase TusA family protein n=1 Tax=Vulcanisaeta sp. JCM 16159 TaxID=1295371 RepID=UPI000AAA0C51|nr:sulfurtransferase TusA family protein [Vulcanisaeta sp. JCM 16159]
MWLICSIIDVRGLRCPTPVTIVANAVDKAEVGSTLTVITDDFICFMMIQRILKILNVEIREAVQLDDGNYRIVVVKSPKGTQ